MVQVEPNCLNENGICRLDSMFWADYGTPSSWLRPLGNVETGGGFARRPLRTPNCFQPPEECKYAIGQLTQSSTSSSFFSSESESSEGFGANCVTNHSVRNSDFSSGLASGAGLLTGFVRYPSLPRRCPHDQ